MTAVSTTVSQNLDPHGGKNYLNEESGLWSWLTTLDHKRIGVMYGAMVIFAFLLGGFFALVVRAELWTAGPTVVSADWYNRAFTLHGAVMIFLFIIPGIPASIGNFVIPIMLGAKDVAFPRLNLMSWYLYVVGTIFFVIALLAGQLDTGWTFYTPYSTSSEVGSTMGGILPALFGAFILGFSSILTGLNFMATVHMLRPRDMGWFQLPLSIWGFYATAVIQILATPVLAITLLLLIAERALQIGIFDPTKGGDPVLFQHFFWFYSHPAVYIMILPAMGVVSELISVFSRKPIFGYKFIAFSSLAIALFGFIVWGHHLFTSGQSFVVNAVFSFITYSVAIPSAIKVFNWLGTMYKGALDLRTPMLYGIGFIWVFSIGGLTGLPLATLATDVHLHDTYFVVAHFHYVMVGGMVLAFLGALHFWWPKIFGRMYNEKAGQWGWAIVFFGFNLTFFIQFIMGYQGMPRRYYNYNEVFEIYHQISTVGSFILAAGLLFVFAYLIHAITGGKRAPKNPWGAVTLEWQTSSPPPHLNFDGDFKVTDPYDFNAVEYDEDSGGYEMKKDYVPAPNHH